MTIADDGNVAIGDMVPTDELHLDGKMRFVSPTETAAAGNAKIFVGALPDELGSLDPALIEDYGNSGDGIILQYGGSSDAGGIKITDDGVAIWGSGDDDLLKVIDEDDSTEVMYIENNGSAQFRNRIDSTTAFRVDALDHSVIFNVDSTNERVGINTTSPSQELEVDGDIRLDFSGGTSSTNGVCHTGADIDGTSSGTNRDLVPCNNSAGDIAEWYEVRGEAEAGDLLVITDELFTYDSTVMNPFTGVTQDHKKPKTISKLERSASTYQETVFGIVSTSPVQTYGADVKYQGKNPQPIALKGRVPVKATTENGAIKPGDKLVASSKPGRAMKATGPGYVIGTAISALDKDDGMVEVFVDLGWDAMGSPHPLETTYKPADDRLGLKEILLVVAVVVVAMQIALVTGKGFIRKLYGRKVGF
jgi:hypothetical protein